jgi:predicted metal-dependent phosphoesterase TrpH
VIDLHLHTTASDGDCSPASLVQRAWTAGLRVIAVTDHDTTGGLAEAAQAAAAFGVRLVPGIEITSVVDCRDVHVLGYFFDTREPSLLAFVEAQRADRVNRAREMGRRLAALGKPVAIEPLLARAETQPGFSISRPAIAQLLVDAGHVRDRAAAFDAFIGEGQPAYVARAGASPSEVAAIVRAAGGITSLAHPVLIRDQARVASIARALDAIEVVHSEHAPEDVTRYRALAESLGLATSGGSDYHGESRGSRATLGQVTLGSEEFAQLESRVPRRLPR